MEASRLAQQAADHIEIARLMADAYDPEINRTIQIPPKVYDEVIGRAWHAEDLGDDADAAALREAVGVVEYRDTRQQESR